MSSFIGDLFTFIADNARLLFLIIVVAVLIEGLVYLFFPKKIKKVVEACPVFLLRIFGGILIILGLIMLHLYITILSQLFME